MIAHCVERANPSGAMPRRIGNVLCGCLLVFGATSAHAACRRPDERSAGHWADLLLRKPQPAIIDGEVSAAQDIAHGTPAIIHVSKVYKGSVSGDLTMNLPPTGDIWTEGYFGFGNPIHSKLSFLLLVRSGSGYETTTCGQVLANDPKVRRIILRRLE